MHQQLFDRKVRMLHLDKSYCQYTNLQLQNFDLDIEKITPKTGDNIDHQLHAAHGHTDTHDDFLHGKINQVFAPGIVYRGKVLRQAKVSMFRCCNVSDEQMEN